MDVRHRYLHANARLYAVGALALLAAAAPAAYAQVSVEVAPLRVELKAKPSGATTQAITVSNTGKEPLRVRATLSNWYLSMDGSPQFSDEGGTKYSASDWVRIAPPEQVVDAGKDGIVRFTVAIPANAEPAGYHTSVLFEFAPASSDVAARGRSVMVRSRVSTVIYVTVGDPPSAVELTDLKTRRTPNQPDQIVAVLKNTGHSNVRTRGTLALYDKAGGKVSEGPVPEVPVLPESEREVAITAFDPKKTPLPSGDYRVEIKIDVGMPALIVGETTLKVM